MLKQFFDKLTKKLEKDEESKTLLKTLKADYVSEYPIAQQKRIDKRRARNKQARKSRRINALRRK